MAKKIQSFEPNIADLANGNIKLETGVFGKCRSGLRVQARKRRSGFRDRATLQ